MSVKYSFLPWNYVSCFYLSPIILFFPTFLCIFLKVDPGKSACTSLFHILSLIGFYRDIFARNFLFNTGFF